MLPNEKRNNTIACTAVTAMLLLFIANLVVGWGQVVNAAQAPAKKLQAELPLVGSMENLKKLLSQVENSGYATGEIAPMMMKQAASSLRNESAKAASIANYDSAYSQTNVQVEGVDEADMVKTDGEYIYKVNQEQIIIIKARPASEMKVVGRLSFDDSRFSPMELYLDSKHLVVIGNSSLETPAPVLPQAKMQACPPSYQYQPFTRVLVYDISNKADIKKIRELELEGNYLSSRKIGSAFYLVSNRSIPCFNIQEQDITLPCYRDSAAGPALKTMDCNEIAYFPDYIYPAYIMLASFDVNNNEKADVKTYLGNGDNIYASDKNLYIALSRYRAVRPLSVKVESSSTVNQTQVNSDSDLEKTTVFKFVLDAAKTSYLGKGEVPGRILNQFSMDENGNYFRIATTSGQPWRSDQYGFANNVYVLDENLNICGKLENLAPGEKIYSTRFMGNRLYMVTFKNVDPLFVIDLSNPQKPSLLGKLKIPGYSDYLHPYDENHIIGFGKESIELKTYGSESQAYYQGMKLAVFDVSDVNNPKEMFKESIGDRGTESELLHNHKALLFSKAKNLLAFPITVMEIAGKNKVNRQGFPEYGSFSFQGAYIYNIDLNKGFQLKGRISHLDAIDYKKAGDSWYDSAKNVERIIYIGDTLYTLSPGMIKANNLSDLKPTGSLNLR